MRETNMADKSKAKPSNRREFLKLSGLGAAAGAAVLTAGGKPAKAAEAPTTKSAGYRETAHVKTAYELARF